MVAGGFPAGHGTAKFTRRISPAIVFAPLVIVTSPPSSQPVAETNVPCGQAAPMEICPRPLPAAHATEAPSWCPLVALAEMDAAIASICAAIIARIGPPDVSTAAPIPRFAGVSERIQAFQISPEMPVTGSV